MAETYPTDANDPSQPNPVHVPPVEQPHTHERTDIATRPLWIFFGAFILIAIVTHIALYVLFFAYERSEAELDKGRVRSLVRQSQVGPPSPRLQGIPGFNVNTPREDMRIMRVEDRQRLTTYGPAQDGVARIPIDRAIDLLLERGLPVQQRSTTQPTTQGAANVQ